MDKPAVDVHINIHAADLAELDEGPAKGMLVTIVSRIQIREDGEVLGGEVG